MNCHRINEPRIYNQLKSNDFMRKNEKTKFKKVCSIMIDIERNRGFSYKYIHKAWQPAASFLQNHDGLEKGKPRVSISYPYSYWLGKNSLTLASCFKKMVVLSVIQRRTFDRDNPYLLWRNIKRYSSHVNNIDLV